MSVGRTLGKLSLFALLLSLVVPVMAKKPPKDLAATGFITDLECARKSASDATAPNHAECARKCSGKGGAMAFITDSDHHVYSIDNAFMVRGMEGQWVTATYQPSDKPDAVKIVSVVPK